MKAASRKAYNAVAERAGGICETCGCRPAEQMHHRKYRSRGGTDDVHNLLHICHGCHGRAHTGEGEALGWSVPSWSHSDFWPVLTAHSGWVVMFNEPDSRGRWYDPITDATATLLMRGEAS